MKTLLDEGRGKKALEDRSPPPMRGATGALVRLVKTSIGGAGLHILRATSQPTSRDAGVVRNAMGEVQSI